MVCNSCQHERLTQQAGCREMVGGESVETDYRSWFDSSTDICCASAPLHLLPLHLCFTDSPSQRTICAFRHHDGSDWHTRVGRSVFACDRFQFICITNTACLSTGSCVLQWRVCGIDGLVQV